MDPVLDPLKYDCSLWYKIYLQMLVFLEWYGSDYTLPIAVQHAYKVVRIS